jgi:hypothetical protein
VHVQICLSLLVLCCAGAVSPGIGLGSRCRSADQQQPRHNSEDVRWLRDDAVAQDEKTRPSPNSDKGRVHQMPYSGEERRRVNEVGWVVRLQAEANAQLHEPSSDSLNCATTPILPAVANAPAFRYWD